MQMTKNGVRKVFCKIIMKLIFQSDCIAILLYALGVLSLAENFKNTSKVKRKQSCLMMWKTIVILMKIRLMGEYLKGNIFLK